MTDPMRILERQAEHMYEAWLIDARRRGFDWNPFTGRRVKDRAWSELDNHTREAWREKALLALRSKETLADELAREDRERKKTVLATLRSRDSTET